MHQNIHTCDACNLPAHTKYYHAAITEQDLRPRIQNLHSHATMNGLGITIALEPARVTWTLALKRNTERQRKREQERDDWNYNTPINWIWLWFVKWIFFLVFSFRAVGWYFDWHIVGRSTGTCITTTHTYTSIPWRKHSRYSRGPLMYLWFNLIWMAQRKLFIVN